MDTNGYDIYLTTSNNFDWNNGGYQLDKDGDTCFVIKAGNYVTINHAPFY
jgi:hypothetical protein